MYTKKPTTTRGGGREKRINELSFRIKKKKNENVFENIANDYNLIIIGPSAFVLQQPAMQGEHNNIYHSIK